MQLHILSCKKSNFVCHFVSKCHNLNTEKMGGAEGRGGEIFDCKHRTAAKRKNPPWDAFKVSGIILNTAGAWMGVALFEL